jgi:hypothetical protein
MDYVKFIYRPLAARAAHRVLVGRHRVRQSCNHKPKAKGETSWHRGNKTPQSIEQLKQMVYTSQEHRGDLLETLLTFASS